MECSSPDLQECAVGVLVAPWSLVVYCALVEPWIIVHWQYWGHPASALVYSASILCTGTLEYCTQVLWHTGGILVYCVPVAILCTCKCKCTTYTALVCPQLPPVFLPPVCPVSVKAAAGSSDPLSFILWHMFMFEFLTCDTLENGLYTTSHVGTLLVTNKPL